MSNEVLYLSRSDIDSLAIPMHAVIEMTESALREKSRGKAIMPAKHWISPAGERFFSAMSGALLESGAVTCKWQSGSPENAKLGLPYITGLLLLNDLATGRARAVMDSTWITAQRTAAATAVAAKYLACSEPRTLAIIGCGVQGRTNLQALRIIHSSLCELRAFDIDPDRAKAYVAEAANTHGIAACSFSSVRETVADADIVVTCGPIVSNGDRIIQGRWLKPGALLVTLDYDCYLDPLTINQFDAVFTDDVEQVEHLKEYGFFAALPESLMELGTVFQAPGHARKGEADRILSVNLGLAIEDTAVADLIDKDARAKGVGTILQL
ncbi:hypothetical protein [Limibacillus sp. MBR-115]|jgi:ornithine cyclodeaminase/alanine dehydrogenase|uniref:ornithine cyclodeaminase family protein n=1 Tax=Limibacillus sp. MBR-115 TaxID=3156465 RepID=UPI003390832D